LTLSPISLSFDPKTLVPGKTPWENLKISGTPLLPPNSPEELQKMMTIEKKKGQKFTKTTVT